MTSADVNQLDNLRDSMNDAYLCHVANLMRKRCRHAHNIVLADRHNLHKVRMLIIVYVASWIMRNQFLGQISPVHRYSDNTHD